MAAAHHAAQRGPYSLPTTHSSTNDDLRLPSIKDLQFNYPRRQQGHSQPNEPPPGYEHGHPPPQDRVNRLPQHWPRQPQPPHTIPYPAQAPPPQSNIHPPHPQQNISPPPPSQPHEAPPKPADYPPRYENNGYATPGLPLSAQTTPVPGSVNSGPAVRSEEYHPQVHNKRARTGDRTPVITHRDTRPSPVYHYQYNNAAMPPPSPYHQSSPTTIQSPVHPSHPPHPSPSPHEAQHSHQPPVPPQQSYAYHHQYAPPRPTNVTHSIPQSAPPPPPVQAPTPPVASAPQATHVLSYAQSAQSSANASQEWEAPPPQPPQHFHHHPPPPPPTAHQPPPSGPPPPSTPTVHHVPHHQYNQHPPPSHPQSHPPPPPPPQNHNPPPPAHSSHPPPQSQPVHYQPQSQPQPLPPPVQQAPQHAPAPAPQTYAKNASINPAELDTRSHYNSTPSIVPPASASPDSMSELVNLCSILYEFASRYSQLNGGAPGPAPHEIIEMANRANEVVRLLQELQQPGEPEGQRVIKSDPMASPDDHRPPKRPWEDMAEEGQVPADEANVNYQEPYPTPVAQQSTAEQDMELIRTKRATTTAGASASTGQPKSKYRKRSANYAKLMRKQNKLHPGPNGEPPPPIDMDTLRASTRAAEAEKASGRKDDTGSPPGAPSHHQGSFQVVNMAPPAQSEGQPSVSPTTTENGSVAPVPTQVPASSTGILQIPPPPWSSPTVSGRSYAVNELQHQSFLRSSIPTTSPR
ncbi:hypothetical protein V5O48_002686 [Marasmius crinis-equi]|uniref:Uncharacterized protein n=1 Tax=Marasmius crinis-equi TaxID=585013 RepID=A0ABR3FUZ2_9AGAR